MEVSPHHGNRGARCRRAHASAAVRAAPIERDAVAADRAGHGIEGESAAPFVTSLGK